MYYRHDDSHWYFDPQVVFIVLIALFLLGKMLGWLR